MAEINLTSRQSGAHSSSGDTKDTVAQNSATVLASTVSESDGLAGESFDRNSIKSEEDMVQVSELKKSLDAIIKDSRYLDNLPWGAPRKGHPEGSIGAHIRELERNLEVISPALTELQILKIQILIHTHDTFKGQATRGAKILDPDSHASLAKAFLQEFSQDTDLANMVQLHDQFFSLWRQEQHHGNLNEARFQELLETIKDWDTFLAFIAVDGVTAGKSGETVRWALSKLDGKITTTLPHEKFVDDLVKAVSNS